MKDKTTSLENLLIINCATTVMNENVYASSLDIIRGDINWEYIFNTAKDHNVAPLMYPNLKKLNNDCPIPQNILFQFRKSYHSNGIRNTKLFNELAILLKAFQENGIEVMLIKGAALAILVYKNIALRPMSDVDILIKKEDATKIKGILLDKGYRGEMPLKRKVFSRFATSLPPFTKGDFLIEVKWRIEYFPNGLKPDFPSYEKCSQLVSFPNNTSALSPLSEDLFFLAYYHIKKHEPVEKTQLIWYCDLLETKRKFNIEESIVNTINPAKILNADIGRKDASGAVSRIFFDIKSVDGLKNRAIYILGSLFPDRNYLSYRYKIENPILIYLYLVLRPFSGIFIILKSLLLRIKNKNQFG